MTDVNSNHMAGLLDFMYSGQVDKLNNFFLENFSSFIFFLQQFRFKLLSFNFLLLLFSTSFALLLTYSLAL